MSNIFGKFSHTSLFEISESFIGDSWTSWKLSVNILINWIFYKKNIRLRETIPLKIKPSSSELLTSVYTAQHGTWRKDRKIYETFLLWYDLALSPPSRLLYSPEYATWYTERRKTKRERKGEQCSCVKRKREGECGAKYIWQQRKCR